MNLRRVKADPIHAERIQSRIKWCSVTDTLFNGFPYDDPLMSSEGICLILFVPEGTSNDACEKAIREARNERDVASYMTVECPLIWFKE